MEEVKVSIHCLAYNHEKYISDTIEGFVMQKTNFKFEVLIHDDASTDNTADIIKKYEKKYPEFIKPIYQAENQYSKGIKVGFINYKRAKGKYIAICEGDDYWTDSNKLQKQYDYMESHPECSMCFHDAILVDSDRSYLGLFPGHYDREEGIKDIRELQFIPTASKMYRKQITDLENIPEWYYHVPYGDFANMLLCSNYGYIYYINDIMTAYRTNVVGSALYNKKQQTKRNPQLQIDIYKKRINELKEYNKWSNYKNDNSVKYMILKQEFYIARYNRDFKEIRKEKFKPIYKDMSYYAIFLTYFKCLIPRRIYYTLKDTKNFIVKK